MEDKWAEYPPFVSWEDITHVPVQHPTQKLFVIWRTARGYKSAFVGAPLCPPPPVKSSES